MTRTTTAMIAAGATLLTATLSANADALDATEVTANDCDINRCGRVEVNDIVQILGDMGHECPTDCAADVDGNRAMDVNDLLHVIARYGAVADWDTDAEPVADTALTGGLLALQNWHHSNPDSVHPTGVATNAVCISSYCLSVHNMTNPESFEAVLNTPADEIREYLLFNANHYGIEQDTTDYLVLDIEGYRFTPMYWGNYITETISYYDPQKLDRILDAYKLRIEIARELFPNAKLCLWDLGSPHPFGIADLEAMTRRMSGYEYAAAYGVYDNLDYGIPVIYQPWGPTDNWYHRNADVVTLGVESARSLTKSDGSPLGTMPMISLTIFNGDSNHDRLNVPLEDLTNTVSQLKDMDIEEYMIWNGTESLATPDSNNSDYTVSERLQDALEFLDNSSNTL